MNEDVGSIETNTLNRNMNTQKNWNFFFVAGTLKSTQWEMLSAKTERQKQKSILANKAEHIIPVWAYQVEGRNKMENIVYSEMWTF